MHTIEQRLARLAGQPPGSIARVLAEAIPHALPAEQPALVRALLKTGHPGGLATLVAHYHRLGERAARLVVEFPEPLRPAVRLMARRRSDRACLNAIELAARRGEAGLAPFLAAILEEGREALSGPAARALLQVVSGSAGMDGRRPLDPEVARALDSSVSAAARSYPTHRQRRAMIAAVLLLPRAGGRLRALLRDHDEPVLFPLRAAAARIEEPAVRRNLLRWLALEPLSRPAARALGLVRRAGDLAEVLEPGHLLLTADRRRVLREGAEAPRIPEPAEAARMPECVQPALVRLVCALSMAPARRRGWLAGAAALAHPMARTLALGRLRGESSSPAATALEAFARDDSPAVALAGAMALEAGGATADLDTMQRSSHPAVARRAARGRARRGADDFFARWLRLGPADRRAAFHAVVARDRDAIRARLAEVIRSGSRAARVAAIGLIRGHAMSADIEQELIAASACEDGHTASAAVSALEARPLSAPRRAALHRALDHPGDRVRANAVEVLGRLEPLPAGVLGDPDRRDNRARANAALIEVRRAGAPGVERVRAMLGDREPLHRISAIWAARRSRSETLIADLVTVATTDSSSEVRARAAGAARYLAASARLPGGHREGRAA